MCVFVKHLNRCKTSTSVFLASRRPGTYDCLSWPTKTRQHGGANVLQFSNFRLTWQGIKPRTPPRHFYFEFCTVAALWYLLIHFLNHIYFGGYLNQSLLAILVFGTSSPRLHTTSWKSTWDPRSCLVAHYWDSVPIGSLQ